MRATVKIEGESKMRDYSEIEGESKMRATVRLRVRVR